MCATTTKVGAKDKMIVSAIELFKKNGVDGVSVKDICDSAGVTRNAFYYHFQSKELLFDFIGDYVSMKSKAGIRPLYGCNSYYQQLWEFYRAYIMTEIEMGADIMNHVCLSRTMKGRADYFSYIDDKLAERMITLINLAKESGQVYNPSSAEDLLWTSYSIIRGVNIKWCFQWGECDILKESIESLDTLFVPANGFKLIDVKDE